MSRLGRFSRERPSDLPDDLSDVGDSYASFNELRGTSSYSPIGNLPIGRWVLGTVVGVAIVVAVVIGFGMLG